MRRGQWAALISVLALAMALPSGGVAEDVAISKYGFSLDTVVMVSAYGADDVLLERALALCDDYERLLSKTIEGSDVWRVNHANGETVDVSPATAEILALAVEVSERSGGAFDITVAPAVALWDFTSGAAALPDAAALSEAAERIDYRKLELNGNTVSLPAGMQIDLGGIAKGYIADRVADFLRENGVKRALVNLGGNVVAVGGKPGGRWKVGIQDPESPSGAYRVALGVENLSVVTSGVYERGFDLDGVRYHHILDTGSGWPVQNGLASVTIIAEESLLADALSTAVFALGLEDGMALVESLEGVEAVFILDDGTLTMSAGAEAMVVD